MLEVALAYLHHGWSVFPLESKRTPHVPWKQYQTQRPTEEEVTRWWTQWPEAWIGLALGEVSRVVRIDADGGGLKHPCEMPATLEFVTPSGGRGWLYGYMDGLTTEVLWKGDGPHEELRLQSTGAYTVLPPSPGYRWSTDSPVAPIPPWLRDRYVEKVLRDLVKELRPTLREPKREEALEALKHIRPDEYDTWIQVGMALRSMEGEDMLPHWIEWSRSSGKFVEGECEHKWAGFSATPGGVTARSLFYWAEQCDGWKPKGRHEPLTDVGNARVLARIAEGKIKHSAFWGWLAWDGKRWAMEDAEKRVQEMQKDVLEHRLDRVRKSIEKVNAAMLGSVKDGTFVGEKAAHLERKRKDLLGCVNTIYKHQDNNRIRGAREQASSDVKLSCDYRRFDQHPYLLNCANCTLDLVNGATYEHNQLDMITQICPTEYEEGALCPMWEQFLVDVLPDDGVRSFVQMFLGSCLTGDVSAQVLPVLWGNGANGKSTFVQTVLYVMGQDYTMKAKRDLLMQKRNTEHPTSIARLRAKRFVACVETSEDGRLDEVLIKELTGGDTIAARRMREDEWEFEPTHKSVLATNHKPEVRGTDDGIWRRLPLVPFTRQFLAADADPGLKEKLATEAKGILRWMVDGCRVWIANNCRFSLPEAVKTATADYRAEQDRVGLFLMSCCEFDAEFTVPVAKLMEAYTVWCIANKHQQLNGQKFGRALNERGYTLILPSKKLRSGLRLLSS